MIKAPGNMSKPVSKGSKPWMSCMKIGIKIIPANSAILAAPIMIEAIVYIGYL